MRLIKHAILRLGAAEFFRGLRRNAALPRYRGVCEIRHPCAVAWAPGSECARRAHRLRRQRPPEPTTMRNVDEPWFPAKDLPALRDFWHVYQNAYDAVQQESLPLLEQHAIFGPILRRLPKELRDAQNTRSRDQLRCAIEDGEWGAYTKQLMEQGVTYARLGVGFRDWYDVVRLVV